MFQLHSLCFAFPANFRFTLIHSLRRGNSQWACDKSRQWHFTLLAGSLSCHFTHKMSPATPTRRATRSLRKCHTFVSKSLPRHPSQCRFAFFELTTLQLGFIFRRGCIRFAEVCRRHDAPCIQEETENKRRKSFRYLPSLDKATGGSGIYMWIIMMKQMERTIIQFFIGYFRGCLI